MKKVYPVDAYNFLLSIETRFQEIEKLSSVNLRFGLKTGAIPLSNYFMSNYFIDIPHRISHNIDNPK